MNPNIFHWSALSASSRLDLTKPSDLNIANAVLSRCIVDLSAMLEQWPYEDTGVDRDEHKYLTAHKLSNATAYRHGSQPVTQLPTACGWLLEVQRQLEHDLGGGDDLTICLWSPKLKATRCLLEQLAERLLVTYEPEYWTDMAADEGELQEPREVVRSLSHCPICGHASAEHVEDTWDSDTAYRVHRCSEELCDGTWTVNYEATSVTFGNDQEVY